MGLLDAMRQRCAVGDLGERLASTQRTGVGAVLVGVVLMAAG